MDIDFEAMEANETKRKLNRVDASRNAPPPPSFNAHGTGG